MSLNGPPATQPITWRAARHAAEIYLGQAVGLLGIGAAEIQRVERGELIPSAELTRRAIAAYRLPAGTILVPEPEAEGAPAEAQPLKVEPTATMPPTIGFRPAALTEARLARGWSFRQAAERLGVTATTVHRLEHEPEQVSGDTILRALQLYGIAPEANPSDHGQSADEVVVVKLRAGRPDSRSTRRGSEPLAPIDPNAPIELVPSPAPGFLIGRTARDRDALRALGGELMRVEDAPLWPNVRVRGDLGVIDLDPTISEPNGLSAVYRARLVDLLLSGQALGEGARELARLVWGVGLDYQEAGTRTGLSDATARAYYFKIKRQLRRLWAMDEVRGRAVELFGSVYGVPVAGPVN